MGYDAVWIPSDGSYPLGYTARVLFKDPDSDKKLAGTTYSSFNYYMEYRQGFFPGLKALVDATSTEQVNINGLNYYIREVSTKADGKTYSGTLELIL
jgi:hypothetical protein